MTLSEHLIDHARQVQPSTMAAWVDHQAANDEAIEFYENIRGGIIDAIDERGEIHELAADEIADSAPSIWHETRMLQIIGTESYNDEPDGGDGSDSISTIAGYVLYELAQDVIRKFLEYLTEAIKSYSDQA